MDKAEATAILGKFDSLIKLVREHNEQIFEEAYNSILRASPSAHPSPAERKTYLKLEVEWLRAHYECTTNPKKAKPFQQLDTMCHLMEDTLSLLNRNVSQTVLEGTLTTWVCNHRAAFATIGKGDLSGLKKLVCELYVMLHRS
eukprot:Phypoly_transcript_20768.p1 GENE.Phypoly_transcript_20768~~Phypoly_transcript_20768.p1  ORF type:complete len:143 (+),score=16.24 Phypoly_transcript_20768:203-631(+)